MEETDRVILLRNSVEKFGKECYNVVTAVEERSDEELDVLENELEAALKRLRDEVVNQTQEILEIVKAKKPPKETPQNDPAYTTYKCLLQETNVAVAKTTNSFKAIFEQIKGLISKIVEKVKKKFVDIGQYIKDEFHKLVHHSIENKPVSAE